MVLRQICELTETIGEKNAKEHQIHKFNKMKKGTVLNLTHSYITNLLYKNSSG